MVVMRHLPLPARGRLRRRSGGVRSPLLRGSDRVERAARVAGLLVFLLTLPLAAWLGARSHALGQQVIRVQLATRQPTVAMLTNGAPAASLVAPGGAATPAGLVPARWSAPDGTRRSGYLRVAAGTPAGAGVPIWVDRSGRVVNPPRTSGQVARSAVGTGIRTAAAGALLPLLSLAVLRRRLDRSRMRAWDTEWAAVAPWCRDDLL